MTRSRWRRPLPRSQDFGMDVDIEYRNTFIHTRAPHPRSLQDVAGATASRAWSVGRARGSRVKTVANFGHRWLRDQKTLLAAICSQRGGFQVCRKQMYYYENEKMKVKCLTSMSFDGNTIHLDGTSDGSWASSRVTTARSSDVVRKV